jgi:hypothetical protein
MPDERKAELLRNRQSDDSSWFMYRNQKIMIKPYTEVVKPLEKRIERRTKIEKFTGKPKMFLSLYNYDGDDEPLTLYC